MTKNISSHLKSLRESSLPRRIQGVLRGQKVEHRSLPFADVFNYEKNILLKDIKMDDIMQSSEMR